VGLYGDGKEPTTWFLQRVKTLNSQGPTEYTASIGKLLSLDKIPNLILSE